MADKKIDRLPGETEAEFQKRYTREKMRRLRAKWAESPDAPKKEMHALDIDPRRDGEWCVVSGALSSVEAFDDGRDVLGEHFERHDDVVVGKRGFVERYVEGSLRLVARRTLPDRPEYVFVIGAHVPARYRAEGLFQFLGPLKIEHAGGYVHDQQPTMLPSDIEVVEGPDGPMAAFIWLERLYDQSVIGGKAIHQSYARMVPVGEQISRRLGDRKIPALRKQHLITAPDGACEDIERTAQDIDIDASLDVERRRQLAPLYSDYQIIRAWRWKLSDDHFEIGRDPSIDPFAEGWELGYGPINSRLSV